MSRRPASPPAAGDALLRDAGIADGEVAPSTLGAIAGRAAALDLAIVTRLGGTPSVDAARILVDLAAGAEARGWRAVAKEVRRVLYRFEQRGIAMPPPTPAPTIPRRPPATALEGWLSAIDGRGDRLVWVARATREGGVAVMTAVLNEPGGLRDEALAEMSRKTLRRMQRDFQERHGLRMVPADGAYCDALLAEGFERARVAGTKGIGEYPTHRTRLTGDPPAPRTPSLYARLVGTADANAARDGAALLDLPELATWILGREVLAPHLDAITAARESPLVLSAPQQHERIEQVIVRALHDLFGGAAGETYQRWLEETAFILHATNRAVPAAAAAATAAALARSDRGGEGIPFCEAFVRRSLQHWSALDAERAAAGARDSLLVRPGSPAPRR